MPVQNDLPTWDQGRLLEHDDLNALSNAIRGIQQRFADNCPENVGQADDQPSLDYFMAIVQADGGSDDTPDPADGLRCWLAAAKPTETTESGDVLDVMFETLPGIRPSDPFLATNLANPLDGGGAMPSPDTPVLCFHFWTRGVDGATSVDVYVFWWSVGGLIPVTVTQSGGANGNSTTAPTYTYNATNAINGVAYTGGPFSVSWARPKGLVTAATHGTAFYDADGNFVLWQVDEKPGGTACT